MVKKSDKDFTADSIQKAGCYRSPDEEASLFSETTYARASVQNECERSNYDFFSGKTQIG